MPTAHAYLYVFYEGGPKPLYSYYALLAFTLGSWVYTASHSNREVSGGGSPATSPLLAWIGLFLAYGALEFLNSPQDFASREAFIILGEACLLTTSFFLFMRDKKTLRKAMAAFAFLAPAMGVAQSLIDPSVCPKQWRPPSSSSYSKLSALLSPGTLRTARP